MPGTPEQPATATLVRGALTAAVSILVVAVGGCDWLTGPDRLSGHVDVEMTTDRAVLAAGDTANLEVVLISTRNVSMRLEPAEGGTCLWKVFARDPVEAQVSPRIWPLRPFGEVECDGADAAIEIGANATQGLGTIRWDGTVLDPATGEPGRLEPGVYILYGSLQSHDVELDGTEYVSDGASSEPLDIEIRD